jgi:hypothetical protein
MRARHVYESVSFERGLDPKESLGIGKFAKLEKELREFFTDILPSYEVDFSFSYEHELNENKFIISVKPPTCGIIKFANHLSTIKDMVNTFMWGVKQRIHDAGYNVDDLEIKTLHTLLPTKRYIKVQISYS